MKRRIISLVLAFAMLLAILPTTAFAANQATYSDVTATAWYYDAVSYVSHEGLMSGIGNHAFAPNATLTRAQLCQILYNKEGQPAAQNNSFTDVSAGAWYNGAVSWAAASHIVDGVGNNQFKPDNPVTREQMVTILYRYAAYKDYSLSEPVSLEGFSDADLLSEWAKTQMQWAVGEGIINGTSATTISPQGTATRAQAAAMLMRFCQRMDAKLEFYAKNMDDFSGEEIINFDDSEETNFAVLEEDTVIAKSSGNINQLISADEDEGVYVFSHVDKTISSLTVGDVLYLTYGDGPDDYVLVKIGAIETNGDTVTITEGKAELSDYFQYIDMDMEVGLTEDGIVATSSRNAATPVVATVVQSRRMLSGPEMQTQMVGSAPTTVAKDITAKPGISFKFGYDGDHIKFTGDAKVTIQVKICFDKHIFDVTEISVSTKTESKVNFEVSVSGKQEKAEQYQYKSPKAKTNVAPGTKAELFAYVKIEGKASATGSISGTITTENGVKYSNGKSYPIQESNADVDADIGGAFNVKFGAGVEGNIRVMKILKLSLSGEGGVELNGKTEVIHASAVKEEKHLCVTCVDGTVGAYFEVDFNVKVGFTDKKSWTLFDFKPMNVKVELAKFYISYRMIGTTDTIEFGWGKCPHKQYLVTVTAQNESGSPLKGVSVWVQSDSDENFASQAGETDSNGIFQCYCDNGSYTISASIEDYQDAERKTVAVNSKAVNATVKLNKKEQPMEEQPTTSTSSPLEDFEIVDGVLVKYKGKGGVVTIPNNVTSIGLCAFSSCSALTGVIIPNSVTSIDDLAFEFCTGLTNVTIPNSVTSIETNAFRGCTGLTSITIPNSVTSIEIGTFNGCTGLTSITIPNSVTSIEYAAFEGCTGLTSIIIPDGVNNIEAGAFSDCTNLTAIQVSTDNQTYTSIDGVLFSKDLESLSVCPGGKKGMYTIPSSVTQVWTGAFNGCTGLTAIQVDAGSQYYTSADGVLFSKDLKYLQAYPGGKKGTYTIPSGVTSIGWDAFYGCSDLTSVTIPNSVTEIMGSAFENCTGLTSVTIPNSVTEIGIYSFKGCTGLTSVTIGNSVTRIGTNAFSGCTGLTSATIPDSVTSIENSAFNGCTGLTSVTIGNSVTSIEASAFNGCTSLTNVTIPDSVTIIRNSVFSGCSALTSVYIPDSVTIIESGAFSGCASLKSVYYGGSEAQWNSVKIGDNNAPLKNATFFEYQTP